MISNHQARQIQSKVRGYEPPVLSLYVPGGRTRDGARATALSVRAAMGSLGVPVDIAEQAIQRVEETPPHDGTRVIFATPEGVDTLDFGVPLVIHPGSSQAPEQVGAWWGEPYTAPLEAALDPDRRYAVMYADERRVRLFEVFLGEIEPVLESLRDATAGEEDELQQSKQVHPAYIPSRGGAAKDLADRHVRAVQARFYRNVAADVLAAIHDHDLSDLILLGPERDLAVLEAAIPDVLKAHVAVRGPSLSSPEASAAEVLARARPLIEQLDAHRDQALVADIVEGGMRGLDATLGALQRGRLGVVAATTSCLEREVYCDRQTGYVSALPVGARPEPGPAAVPMSDVLPRLARQYAARLRVLAGAGADRLTSECDGIGGLLRW